MRDEAKDVLDQLKTLPKPQTVNVREFRELYEKAAKIVYDKFENNLNEKLQFTLELIDIAKENKDHSLLDAIIGANDLFFKRTSRIYLDINMEIARQFWSSSIQDVIGSFQFLKDPIYIDQLHKVAVDSLPGWAERGDSDQEFSANAHGRSVKPALVSLVNAAEPLMPCWRWRRSNRRLPRIGQKSRSTDGLERIHPTQMKIWTKTKMWILTGHTPARRMARA